MKRTPLKQKSSLKRKTPLRAKTSLKAKKPGLKLRSSSTKMSKKSVAQLKKLADKHWSTYIRLRDAGPDGYGECISCGVRKHWKELQCGHFVSRRVSALRFDELNTNAQCVSCNMFKQGEQYGYSKGLDAKYGKGVADKLWEQRFSTHTFTVGELESIIAEAKEQIAQYDK